jgi:hypothetical protein
MDATHLVFGIKDVIAIILGVISILGFLFALKRSSETTHTKLDSANLEHQAYKQETTAKLIELKADLEKKEVQFMSRIEQVRAEHRDDHEKLWVKIDSFEKTQQMMLTSLAELTGYLRAKNDSDKKNG